MRTLREKKAYALRVISESLTGCVFPSVFFRGDLPGAVLIHLVVKSIGGGHGLNVIFARGPGTPVQIGWYADKLKRLWGFKMTTRIGIHDPAELVTELRTGVLFTSDTSAFKDGSFIQEVEGLTEVRPFFSFTVAEVAALFDVERLPSCSVWHADGEGSKSGESSTTPLEKDEVARRLAALGYL